MIRVRCLGHIATSVGARDLELGLSDVDAKDLVDAVRALSAARDPGFDAYNTLVMVRDGEAFVAASAERTLKDGEDVVLIPVSHGG